MVDQCEKSQFQSPEDETSMQLSFFDEHKVRNRKLGMVMLISVISMDPQQY